ncbi:MAG: DUF4157 domain-containing protein [Crocosphaera sp.]|nr:DUF4157 domain-containing protein [Crocosphaera sp.]
MISTTADKTLTSSWHPANAPAKSDSILKPRPFVMLEKKELPVQGEEGYRIPQSTDITDNIRKWDSIRARSSEKEETNKPPSPSEPSKGVGLMAPPPPNIGFSRQPKLKVAEIYKDLSSAITPIQRLARLGDPTQENSSLPIQAKVAEIPNRTGLPDNLKAGVENISGYSLDRVKVHYNSPKPAQLQAFAYTQGTDIHLAPGQEKHLPHEAWHVVQQKQGRVKRTNELKGYGVNADSALEKEAEKMGEKGRKMGKRSSEQSNKGEMDKENSKTSHPRGIEHKLKEGKRQGQEAIVQRAEMDINLVSQNTGHQDTVGINVSSTIGTLLKEVERIWENISKPFFVEIGGQRFWSDNQEDSDQSLSESGLTPNEQVIFRDKVDIIFYESKIGGEIVAQEKWMYPGEDESRNKYKKRLLKEFPNVLQGMVKPLSKLDQYETVRQHNQLNVVLHKELNIQSRVQTNLSPIT